MTFASSRLIDAMALPADVVMIGDVDDERCDAAVRRMGYLTLELLLRADALYPEESEDAVVEWVDGNGVGRREWLLATPGTEQPPPRARWRSSFEPIAKLFLVAGTPRRAAADPLAARILASGAVGLDFAIRSPAPQPAILSSGCRDVQQVHGRNRLRNDTRHPAAIVRNSVRKRTPR